ncbi:PDZ domain-containing protein [Streptomyces sp. NPDC001380]|uniref:S41 family peptidase n=1 Tax=Streptomyces sp. NPDC001380 TaxID=3364566 RepID=UPI0036CAEC4F
MITAAHGTSAHPGTYLRHPHLHGDLVTFVAEDDVWIAPLDGGRAWRLSADRTPVAHPRFSPDGSLVAWTSTRDGAPEIHVAPVDGGPARRLTHWGSAKTALRGWTPGGEPVAITTAGQSTLRRTWAFAVPLDGGEPRRLPYGPIGGIAFEPGAEGDGGDARVLLLSAGPVGTGREPAHWKRYRGGTAGKLWLGRTGGEFHRVHADLDTQIDSPMWVGGRIAFLSDHDGTARLWSSLPDGGDLRRHGEGGFYARNATTDGTRTVWHEAGELWLLDSLDGGAPRRLDVALGGPRTGRQPFPVPAGHHLGVPSPDRTGRASAVTVRGTVHWVTHRDGPVRALAAEPGVRARLARVVPARVVPAPAAPAGDARGGDVEAVDAQDGAAGPGQEARAGGAPGGDQPQGVVWVTDAEGEDALEYAPSTGAAPGAAPCRIAAGRLGRVLDLVAAPDGRRVAVASHDGRVLLVGLEDGEVREVARSEDGDVCDLAFSPDSGWLAWSHPGPWPLRQLKIADTESLEVADATPLRFNDTSPSFTADGRHLAFLSIRNFDPVYDAHVFDLSFPTGCRPYLLTLAADTPSPFGPQRDGRPFGGGDGGAEPKGGEDAEDGGAGRAPATRVDLDGLADRIVPFPVPGGRFGDLRAAGDGVLWTRLPVAGVLGDDLASPEADELRPVLERYDLKALKDEELLDGLDAFAVSGDGSRIAVLDHGRLRVLPADRKVAGDGSDDDLTVDLSRVRATVDPGAEWRQMFDENGRLARDNFWREDMNGVDWDGVLARYRPLVDRLGSHDDLVDLLWEVQGELGTSHAYVSPPGRAADEARRQGLLGADLVRDGDVWRVARVLPGESSDPRARSPLAAPGVAVRTGDALTAVDGRPVDPVTGPMPLLAGAAGRPVELTVAPAGGGAPRQVVVVPLADEEPLRYHDWVAGRRAETHRLSQGRVGYLHVPDMVGAGWAQLHRDLRVEMAREGVVVDLRENRGGHTSQLVVEKLNRRVVSWGLTRGVRSAEPYPSDAPRGAVVALANEFSGSDGDIVNAAIQALGIGPVVGVRTWGGVIGIDGRYSLVDGTGVTQPKYATWFENYGWGLENHGADPDVEVVMAPHHWAAGEDPQLAEGVRIALASLAERPAKRPPALPEL